MCSNFQMSDFIRSGVSCIDGELIIYLITIGKNINLTISPVSSVSCNSCKWFNLTNMVNVDDSSKYEIDMPINDEDDDQYDNIKFSIDNSNVVIISSGNVIANTNTENLKDCFNYIANSIYYYYQRNIVCHQCMECINIYERNMTKENDEERETNLMY